jgi:hypothetical protein
MRPPPGIERHFGNLSPVGVLVNHRVHGAKPRSPGAAAAISLQSQGDGLTEEPHCRQTVAWMST